MRWSVVFLLAMGFSSEVQARGSMGREDFAIISNGQGISSPSFSGALFGENPAGLVQNQRLKLQAGVGAMDDSTSVLRARGAVLAGNGSLGAGVGYSQFDSAAYATGVGAVHWGLAGTLHALSTSIGLAGRTFSGGTSTYDLGLFFDFIPRTRIGALAKNIGNGLNLIGAGLLFKVDSMVDLVLDADYETRGKQGVVKPGFTLHTDRVDLSIAYGFRYVGTGDVYLYSRMTAGLGIRLFDQVLLQYQYRNQPQHLLGLTMRLN